MRFLDHHGLVAQKPLAERSLRIRGGALLMLSQTPKDRLVRNGVALTEPAIPFVGPRGRIIWPSNVTAVGELRPYNARTINTNPAPNQPMFAAARCYCG